jgi:hypothetical protein
MSSSRRLPILLAALLAASSVRAETAPGTLPPDPPPAPARRPLVWAGATLFMVPYVASVLAATTGYLEPADTTSARGFLWIPAVGPFLMMGKASTAGQDALLVLDGLAQIGGLTLFVYGMTTPRMPGDARPKTGELEVVPMLAGGARGATIVATF